MFRTLCVIAMCVIVVWLTWTASQEPQVPRKGPAQDAADYFAPLSKEN